MAQTLHCVPGLIGLACEQQNIMSCRILRCFQHGLIGPHTATSIQTFQKLMVLPQVKLKALLTSKLVNEERDGLHQGQRVFSIKEVVILI